MAAIDARYAANITVYHVNEHRYGAIPLNMNTMDAVGALTVALLDTLMSLLNCGANRSAHHHHGPDPCAMPEAVNPKLVLNKVTLEVDRRFSGYGACNVGIDGADPFGSPCATDTFCCDCATSLARPRLHGVHELLRYHRGTVSVPCNTTLGRENVYEQFERLRMGERGCKPTLLRPHPTPSDCYTANFFSKLSAAEPGWWYSSLAKGYCADASRACTWRVVSVDRIIHRECHTRVFGAAVLRRGSSSCLEACGAQRAGLGSACWADCFYRAALGPDSHMPHGAVAGLSFEELRSAWLKPFLPEQEGGCPAQAEHAPWGAGGLPSEEGKHAAARHAREHRAAL